MNVPERKQPRDYYSLRLQANALIIDVISAINQSIKEGNPKQITFNSLLLEFQEKFGFGEKMLLKMLETYVKEGRIHFKDGVIS